MNGEIAIVAIVFGSIITIISIIAGIVKTGIKEKAAAKSITQDDAFLEALRQFKEKTDRRLSRLEARETAVKQEKELSVNNSDDRISIPSDESGDNPDEAAESSHGKESASGQLRNMLKNS